MMIRLTPQTLLVLDAFLVDTEAWRYGYELSQATGLKSGTLYPILMRMEERRLLETAWETNEPGRPPRHIYRLTPEGMQFARGNRLRAAMEPLGGAAFEGQK
ncbi:MAG TPA: helix-turn-helix transcriptional regulator [Acidobacteriaceae bacterium]